MQKLEGDGLAFVHAGGTIIERELGAGEKLRVDTGCLVALETPVTYDIEFVGGVKSAIFGGEGFFFARLEGPGQGVAPVAAVLTPRRPHLAGRTADRWYHEG